jgi:hypothetical protein
VLSRLPAVIHQGFVAGYAESIQTVFLVAVPIAGLAFLASWLIPQVELKRWPETGPAPLEVEMPVADTTGAPEALASAPLAAGPLAAGPLAAGPLAADASQSVSPSSAEAGIRARE